MIKKLLPLVALCLSFSNFSFAQCTAQITPAGPLTVCEDDVVTLSATPGGDHYDWIVNGALVSSGTADNITVLTSSPNTLNYHAVVIFGSCTTNTNNVVVTVNDKPDAPVINSNSPVCFGQTLHLVASTVPGAIYQWQSPCLATSFMQNWSIPSVSQCYAGTYTITVTANGCTSDEAYLNVSVNAQTPPPVTNPLQLCQFSTPQPLTAIGSNLLWYTTPSGGIGTSFAPMANTTVPGSTSYYVSQTLNGCESERAILVVSVLPQPTPPVTTTSITYCQYSNSTQLTATGTNLTWYDQSMAVLPAAPTPGTTVAGVFHYYVTQTINGCESDNAQISVTVNPNPNIAFASYTDPTVSTPGTISLFGLTANTTYQVNFTKDNVPQSLMITSNVTGTVIITGLTAGTYDNITVTIYGCTSNAMGSYVLVIQPNPVWPGDVNWDLVANNDDILDLGLAFGQTGNVRNNASLNWVAQPCTEWGIAQVNGADMMHADCNGDGTVDATDENAVNQNYGLTHLKGVHIPQAKSTAFPDLYFDLTGINFFAGTTVNIPIKLGTSSMPMNNILGIAAKIKVTNVALDNAPTISNSASWMGNSGNTINFTKDVSTSQTDWAYVRTDHNNVSGEGTIAILTMQIPANAPAQDVVLYFDNVKMINANGDVLTDYNVVDDTATIIPVSIKSTVNSILDKATIVPNPSEAQADLQITLAQSADVQITIADMTGKKVWSLSVSAVKGQQNISLPAGQLASGVYHIMISTDRMNIAPIKWIKK